MNGNDGSKRDDERIVEWSMDEELRFQATLVVGRILVVWDWTNGETIHFVSAAWIRSEAQGHSSQT